MWRRSTTPRLDGPTMRVLVLATISRSRASRAAPSAPASAKPLASAVTTGTPSRPHSSIASMVGFGGRDDIDVLRHLGQRGERRQGALAQHLVAPRVDRIDAARVAGLAQIFQRPPGGLGRVVRLADDGDRLRREGRRRARVAPSDVLVRPPGAGASGTETIPPPRPILGGRWSNRRSNTCSAMRFFRISTEPPAIIQPRQRRMQYSTSADLL